MRARVATVWRDERGFHMLSHDKNQSGVYPLWYNDLGGLAFSVDGISWTPPDAGRNAYNTTVDPFWCAAGGSRQGNQTLSSRQRPFLFFDKVAEGGGGGTFLFNGVGLPGKSHWNFSCTFVQQLDTGAAVAAEQLKTDDTHERWGRPAGMSSRSLQQRRFGVQVHCDGMTPCAKTADTMQEICAAAQV